MLMLGFSLNNRKLFGLGHGGGKIYHMEKWDVQVSFHLQALWIYFDLHLKLTSSTSAKVP